MPAEDGRGSTQLTVAAPKNALQCVDTVVIGCRWEIADARSRVMAYQPSQPIEQKQSKADDLGDSSVTPRFAV